MAAARSVLIGGRAHTSTYDTYAHDNAGAGQVPLVTEGQGARLHAGGQKVEAP